MFEYIQYSLNLFGITDKITVFNKINLLFFCILLTFGTINIFGIIYTHIYHITCTKDGKCSYYNTIHNIKPNTINFNITVQSKLSCDIKKSENNKNYYRLIIKDLDSKDFIEIPKAPKVMPIKKCELFTSVIQPIIKSDDKTLNYIYYPDRKIPWYGYIFLLFIVCISCWVFYLTYIVFTVPINYINSSENHINKKC